jgi:hypothetical protein
MAGIAVTAAMNRGDRTAALVAVERMSDPQQRENIMRRYGFFEQLAEVRLLFVLMMHGNMCQVQGKVVLCTCVAHL